MNSFRVMSWTLVACLAAGGVGQAQESDPALQTAKADFEEAQSLYVQEKFEEAAAKFESAYQKKEFGAFLFNAAVSFEKAGRLDEAIRRFERYLEKEPDAKDAEEVRSRIASLKALTAPPAPPPPEVPGAVTAPPAPPPPATVLPAIATKGLVIIDSKPPGANIYLDNKTKGIFARTPWQGSLPPKPVKVMVESKGFKPEARSISPRTDKIYEVYIALSEEHFLGWVEILSSVPGAEVLIDRMDGGAIGRTPYTGHVKPGKHTIWLRRPGYQVARKDIEVQPGTATTHTLTLEKVGHAWITASGKDTRGGRMAIDGVFACNTPCQHQVTPGSHRVEIEKDGMEPYRGQVQVERAQEARLDVRFSPKPSRRRAWHAAVVSALFLGGGIYLGLETRRLEDDLRAESQDPMRQLNTGDPRVGRGKLMALGADGLFVVGALTGLVATWGFLSSGPDSIADVEQRSIGWAPVGLPGGAGLVARGSF